MRFCAPIPCTTRDLTWIRTYVMTLIVVSICALLLQTGHFHITHYHVNYQSTINLLHDIDVVQQQLSAKAVHPGWIKNGPLYEFPSSDISILSATARNRTGEKAYSEIVLNGWEGIKHLVDELSCCFYYSDGHEPTKTPVIDKNHWYQCKRVPYIATQYACANVRHLPNQRPTSVSVIPTTLKNCPRKLEENLDITYPTLHDKTSLGLCSKISYGDVSPRRLVEWHEVYKKLGVNKVITYTYNLSEPARNVLEYYQQQGFVDLHPFNYPHQESFPRSVGEKTPQVFNDEQVATFDCVEQLKGYSYVGLLDHDEFLFPVQPEYPTLQNLFDELLQIHPNSSGFLFKTELHITEWDRGIRDRTNTIQLFNHRTKQMLDRPKYIFQPSAVVPGSVWTHGFEDIYGYQKLLVNHTKAVLKHYRSCRSEWLTSENCIDKRKYSDYSLTKFVSKLSGQIQAVLDHLKL